MSTVTKVSWEVRWTIISNGVEAVHRRPTREHARNLMRLVKRNERGGHIMPLIKNARMYRVHEIYDTVEDKYYSVTKRAR